MRPQHDPTIIAALVKLQGRVVDVRPLDSRPYRPPRQEVERPKRRSAPLESWPRHGAVVHLVEVHDAGHYSYRLHRQDGRLIPLGLFSSEAMARVMAVERGWIAATAVRRIGAGQTVRKEEL